MNVNDKIQSTFGQAGDELAHSVDGGLAERVGIGPASVQVLPYSKEFFENCTLMSRGHKREIVCTCVKVSAAAAETLFSL